MTEEMEERRGRGRKKEKVEKGGEEKKRMKTSSRSYRVSKTLHYFVIFHEKKIY